MTGKCWWSLGETNLGMIWHRLNRRWLIVAFGLAVSLAMGQFLQKLPRLSGHNPFFLSPYTEWLGIDNFSALAMAYYLLLPLLAVLPVGSLLQQDLRNGFHYQLRMKRSVKAIFRGYFGWSFILGGLVVSVPLVMNLLAYLLVLPNLQPDNLLHSNVLVVQDNTINVGLYYAHPFWHAMLSIGLVFVWGALLSCLVTGLSFFTTKPLVAFGSLVFGQIGLLMVDAFNWLPHSLAPANLLKESANASVTGLTMVVLTLGLGVVTLGVMAVGWRRYLYA